MPQTNETPKPITSLMLEGTNASTSAARAALAGSKVGDERPSLAAAMRRLMEDAASAQAHRAHTPAGFQEPTAFFPTAAARSIVASLKTENLPALFNSDGELIRTPKAAPAGTTVKIDAGLVAGSRVAQAGAHVVAVPEAITPLRDPRGTIATQTIPKFFRTIQAAKFAAVDIDNEDDAPLIALPVLSAPIDWKTAKTFGVRFELPRSARTLIDPDQLSAEILAALTLGLSRAADECLLAALGAETLAPFTLAAAASQGLKFAELRAIVGTNAAGASVGQDGQLRAAGVRAELTGDMAGTLIGAWDRAGVAVRDDLAIHFERTSLSGALAVTAWVGMLPLVPDPTKFWTLA